MIQFVANHSRRFASVRQFAGALVLAIVLVCITGGAALGVVGGKEVSITEAPWTVVVLERSTYAGMPRYEACTGVIVDPLHVLTAGHCVMRGGSATLEPPADFTIQAGISDFAHALGSDHPQLRPVGAVRAMPGYMATSQLTAGNANDEVAHDLAVLTLTRPLHLNGADAQAIRLPNARTPSPTRGTRLEMTGFGREESGSYANGTLNEIVKPAFHKSCSTSRSLCLSSTAAPCLGDSGSGLIEPGPDPTVVGILSQSEECGPGEDSYYVFLGAQAVLRFIRSST